METLKQRQYAPYPMEDQVILLYCAKNGYLSGLPYYDVARFNQGLITYVKSNDPGIRDDIRATNDFTPETEARLKTAADRYKETFKHSQT